MSRQDDIFALYPETITQASGVTNIFIPIPGQLACTIKYGAGGTLYFYGSSQSYGNSFATANKYLIGGTEIFNFDSSGYFSVGVEGATCIYYVVRAQSAGFTQL